ncbi:MAG: glycogen/starch/alpha-glucan phosphorylase [Calditrichia bacterium]
MKRQVAKRKRKKADEIRSTIRYHAKYSLGKSWEELSDKEKFKAVALAVREYLIDAMKETEDRYSRNNSKRVYYLSMEFLMGRALGNNLINLELYDLFKEASEDLGLELEEVASNESDAALGNGGLGRLAACFLDSLATLNIPGFGYGINYEYGLFRQKIHNGYQKEYPDHWMQGGTPWEIARPDELCAIPVFGHVEHSEDTHGNYNPMWMGWELLIGIPYDMPIAGFGGDTVNYLRLYSARSSDDFNMTIFNGGDYIKAVEQKIISETVSKVLYPSDAIDSGKELRLIQEYFLVACSLRDILRRYLRENDDISNLHKSVAIQLNDTHPALAVAELMRILVDEHSLQWEEAWAISTQTFGYTNHTLLPEALEKWSVHLVERVVPRHMQIIYEINRRFLDEVRATFPYDEDRIARMSIIEEGDNRQVRMAYLSIVGSHSVNGVAALHSKLVTTNLVPDFYQMWPEKFNNKTNGVTQRRWLLRSNPGLSALISDTIGPEWITNLDKIKGLEPFAEYETFQRDFMDIKFANKQRLAKIIRETNRITVNPNSLFDIQIKRIHEYKRQLLNVMHIIHQYFCIVEDGQSLTTPRTYIFAGKAAPGYWAAKQIIKLINNVGRLINSDQRVGEQLKVVFLPDYRVSLAEHLFPAADVSEQISTAGMEASGTGNMKFALNGALTIGTLDGANVEIREEVGEDNIFIFGLKAHEIIDLEKAQSYSPREIYDRSNKVRRVVDSFRSGLFCSDEPGLFDWITDKLLSPNDSYFHLADFESYIAAQESVSIEFQDRSVWARKAILNVARIGKFSSDRTIEEYAKDIWDVKAVK